jgi:polyisoprenoid-binding protein YceI
MNRSIRGRAPALARLGLAAALLIAAAGRADDARPMLLALEQGTLSYTVVHKLHEVTGSTRKLEGLAKLQPGGPTLVQVRAPVASFDSGNSNRDAHMREATREPLHPFAEVKGTLPPLTLPLAGPQDLTLDARVELNGIQQKQTIPVHLEPAGQRGVRARFTFPISLDAFQVERPELLLIKIDDRATISGDVLFSVRE